MDFAIALESWDQFQALKTALVDSGAFTPAADKVHLLLYQPAAYGIAFPLDLIPFGGVEQEAHRIAWPPDMNVVMSVTGYAEALASAIDVDTGNGLVIRVVSIPALAALKLLAWNDRGLRDNKDAQDLLFLLQHYHEAGNSDRMYEDGYGLLEAAGFDVREVRHVHRYGMANALLWLRERKPSGRERLTVIDHEADALWRAWLESTGRADNLYMLLTRP